MLKMPVPEIQRCNLTSVILQLLSLGVNCLTYDFIDKPSREVHIHNISAIKSEVRKTSLCKGNKIIFSLLYQPCNT